MREEIKRVFFAWEANAPWPEELPSGRVLEEHQRHMTFAFLGNINYSKLSHILPSFPEMHLDSGFVGCCDHVLFLPPHHPHVVAWHVNFYNFKHTLVSAQKTVNHWLKQHHFNVDEREFLPHITVSRSPFNEKQWKDSFTTLPCTFSHLHLYESIGNLQYKPLWTKSFPAPFDEIEHTADIAYSIRGNSLQQLQLHALVALAFRSPQLIQFFPQEQATSFDALIENLNSAITRMDSEIDAPFKAISYHGTLEKKANLFEWEMIVDV